MNKHLCENTALYVYAANFNFLSMTGMLYGFFFLSDLIKLTDTYFILFYSVNKKYIFYIVEFMFLYLIHHQDSNSFINLLCQLTDYTVKCAKSIYIHILIEHESI